MKGSRLSQHKTLLFSICSALMLVHISANEGVNLASLSGVVASQSTDCGARKPAKKAIDGKRKTYSYACRKKKDAEPEWFKLTLEDEATIKQVVLVPWHGRSKTLKDVSVKILDGSGVVQAAAQIDVRGKKRGSITVEFEDGPKGREVIIERSQGSKKRRLRLGEVEVYGVASTQPEYYLSTAVIGCPPGKGVTKEKCVAVGLLLGGKGSLIDGVWDYVPAGCSIANGYGNKIGFNGHANPTDKTNNFRKFSPICKS